MPGEPAASSTGTATILFTDLVGSTALRAQLGKSGPRRQAHHRFLAHAVTTERTVTQPAL